MEKEHDLAKWLAGEMTEAERAAFEQTPEFALYDKIAAASSRLHTPEFKEEAMLQHVLRQPKKQVSKVVPLYSRPIFRVAAILVIALGVWFGTRSGNGNSLTVAQTAPGTIQTLQLPDRSEVTLNAGSSLSFQKDGWEGKRQTHLKGEAFFHVSKGNTFDVLTNLGKVTVVGTQFDVKVRGQRFEVACFEGKVRVQVQGQRTLITKGQIVAFENGKPIKIFPETASTPGWMHNELVFKSERLPAIKAELERHFALKITLPAKVSSARFTGMLPGNDPATAIQLICNTYKLKIARQKGNTIDLIPAAY